MIIEKSHQPRLAEKAGLRRGVISKAFLNVGRRRRGP